MKKIFLCGLLALAFTATQAQVPGTLSYQGILLNNFGEPVTDSVAQVAFFFYSAETGGTSLADRGPFNVKLKKGLFSVILGDGKGINNASIPPSYADQQIWMGVVVGGGTELSPRVKFTSVPYAYKAENANKATLASGVEAGKVVQTLNGLKDAITLKGSSGVTVSENGNEIDIAGTTDLVKDLNGLKGSLNIVAGTNISSIDANGTSITINAAGGLAGSGASGKVAFWNSPSSLAGSTGSLVWDDVFGRLGIGVPAPSAALDVLGEVKATSFTGSLDFSNVTNLNSSLLDLADGTLTDSKLEAILDRTAFNASGNITAGGFLTTVGGIHVGGPSDPGTDNLVVDGTATIGASGQFVVNASGNISKLNNVNYSFPGSQGGIGSFLSNNGSGSLSWTSAVTSLNGATAAVNLIAGTNISSIGVSGGSITINAAGNVSGTGASGRVSFWNGTSSQSSNSNLFWDDANSNLGIGTTPTNKLDVEDLVAASTTAIVNVNRSGDGYLVNFQRNGVGQGTIQVTGTTVAYNGFTGSHFGVSNDDLLHGELVASTGRVTQIEADRGEHVYEITRSAIPNDSKILGSYGADFQMEGVALSIKGIMAVGNGVIWVVDNGEDLSVGDFLISSNVPGHAMKDNGAYDIAYIVARVVEPVNWAEESASLGGGSGPKHKLVSVYYETFIRNNRAEKLMGELADVKVRLQAIEAALSGNTELRKQNIVH